MMNGAHQPDGTPRFLALRGATSVCADESRAVADAVRELLVAILDVNSLGPDDVVSALFSATPDLHCLYPAAIARSLGWSDVPMLCLTEMDVVGAPPRCIRVLLHLSVRNSRRLCPVYLHEARALRPDLELSQS